MAGIMRLYLLPISTRRTLLYCHRLNVSDSQKTKSLLDKVQDKAAKTWTEWEQREKGWQKLVVNWGNQAFRRIPYEEWGLKSVPPLSTKRREEEILGKDKNQLVFPETIIPTTKAINVLRTLGTERELHHKSRLLWCFIGMPISAPIALVPL